jgi:hypothetical protein
LLNFSVSCSFVRDWTSIVMNISSFGSYIWMQAEIASRIQRISAWWYWIISSYPGLGWQASKLEIRGIFLISWDFWGLIRRYVSILLQGARASASLRFDNEKEVFDFLGFPWLEPHERNLWNAFGLCELATQRPKSRPCLGANKFLLALS